MVLIELTVRICVDLPLVMLRIMVLTSLPEDQRSNLQYLNHLLKLSTGLVVIWLLKPS